MIFAVAQALLPAILSHLDTYYIFSFENLTITGFYYPASLMLMVWMLYLLRENENGYLSVWTALSGTIFTLLTGCMLYQIYWNWFYPDQTPGKTIQQLIKSGAFYGFTNIISCIIASLLMMHHKTSMTKKALDENIIDASVTDGEPDDNIWHKL